MKRFRREILSLGLLTLLVVALSSAFGRPPATVAQWTRFEAEFTSAIESYPNPLQDVRVEVEFTSPSGRTMTTEAFWDGFRIWRVRFSPEERGRWTYRTRSSQEKDAGLHDLKGAFECVAYRGRNPLYARGALRVSGDRRYMTYADGAPFFWLGDTAWNGVLKADAPSWDEYLRDRAAKGFNVVQYVTTQWRTAAGNADGRAAFYGRERIEIDPVFFQWMDERVDAINDHGLVAAPILIWAHERTAQFNPGGTLSDDQIVLLARYMVARYGAHHIVWMLAGDADYRGERAERWRKIGRAVFGERPHRLATMHPGGRMWVQDEFSQEPWFGFNGYQSGHSTTDESHRWHTEGPPARGWQKSPAFPSINLEPNYEDHIGRPLGKVFTAYEVRRAAYWSLLVAPPAGVSYGGHGIWSWERTANPPMTHPYTGIARPWREALRLPGSVSMKLLKDFFTSFEWWRLRPVQELLVAQPGNVAPANFIAAAKSEEIAVVYAPAGGEVELKMDRFAQPVTAEWFDPATGGRTALGRMANRGTKKFKAAGKGDRVLVLRLRGESGSKKRSLRRAKATATSVSGEQL
jgi:Protein of unknown function (DUF4038)/Domain of unknown function (DUF5060)/Putative collagen-binding domain of a collagenase